MNKKIYGLKIYDEDGRTFVYESLTKVDLSDFLGVNIDTVDEIIAIGKYQDMLLNYEIIR